MVSIIRNWILRNQLGVILIFITLLAFVLRFYKLDYKNLWIDELYSIVPTDPVNSVPFIVDYCKSDQPPFYFLSLHFWFQLFHYDSFYGRLFSVVVGTASVIAMFFLAREIKDPVVGLFAAFLCSINHYLIYYSQELRFYSMLFLLATISFLFFIRVLKNKKNIDYCLYALSTISLLYTQYYGFILFVVQGFMFVAYVVLFKETQRFFITGIMLALVITVAFLPWIPTLLFDSQITSYWIEKPKFYFPASYFFLYWGKNWPLCVFLLFLIYLYLRKVAFTFKSKQFTQDNFFVIIVLMAWIALSYGIPYVRSLLAAPILYPRYTLITLPAIILIIAIGWGTIKSTYIQGTCVLIVLFFSIYNLKAQGFYTKSDNPQFREATELVKNNYKEGTTLVYSNLAWWISYYFRDTNPRFWVKKIDGDDKVAMDAFTNLVEGHKKIWIISGSGMQGMSATQKDYVEEKFEKIKVYPFNNAEAVLYEKK